MKDKSIIFNAKSVQAILAGRKTQHRVVVCLPDNYGLEFTKVKNISANPSIAPLFEFSAESRTSKQFFDGALLEFYVRCPYQIGQKLWVRETWCDLDSSTAYKARDYYLPEDCKWCSPVTMPRWASRITRVVTNIRCERLQGICWDDCIREGVSNLTIPYGIENQEMYRWLEKQALPSSLTDFIAKLKHDYEMLWGQSWITNPWVWVIDFKYVKEVIRYIIVNKEQGLFYQGGIIKYTIHAYYAQGFATEKEAQDVLSTLRDRGFEVSKLHITIVE